MLTVLPGQSNSVTLPLVNGGTPITSGTVTFYLVRLDTLASVSTAGTHIANGHWFAEFASAAWIEGVLYLCYAKESGGLQVSIGQYILCSTQVQAVLPNQINQVTLPLVDADGNPITTGDVTFTLVRLDTLATATASGTHIDNGHWTAEFAADDWSDGVQYLCYATASDGSQIPAGTQLLCSESATPTAPVITVAAGTDSLTVSITGDAGVLHTVKYKLASAPAWSVGGIRSGDGDVVISSLSAGTYQVIAYSSDSGVLSQPSNLQVVVVASTASADSGMIARLEVWAAGLLAELTYGGSALFKTAAPWRYQVGLANSGVESYDRFAPFAFVKVEGAEAAREGDYDLNFKLRLVIAFGQVSTAAGSARIGDADTIGCSQIADLVRVAFDGIHPGSGFDCDEFNFTGLYDSVEDVKRHAMEMHFEANWLPVTD